MPKQPLSESIDSDSSWEGRADKSPIDPIAEAKRLWEILLPPKKPKWLQKEKSMPDESGRYKALYA